MIRKVIQIEEDKCNGCKLCVTACHEGAIGMVNGKAKLLREDYCDGLGDCLPTCPTGAITFVEREAAAYDEAAVKAHLAKDGKGKEETFTCPGLRAASIARPEEGLISQPVVHTTQSQLRQWPVQIKLAPVVAPYFEGAHLLIAADCAAYAYADFHHQYMRNKVTLIGCPKLDAVDYGDKLTEILQRNHIKSVTVVRMEVPCCSGIEAAVKRALSNTGKMIPWQIVTISTDGRILED